MSQEVFEIVQGMDLKDIQNQLALQCAPLIAGLKTSNLLIIQNMNVSKVKHILKSTDISYFVLVVTEQKTTLLLYNRRRLETYLADKNVTAMLHDFGYQSNSLQAVLPVFQKRYQKYLRDTQEFPHEMGLLLGYPAEDVDGFIKNNGKNALYTGYWKVYENLSVKRTLFSKFDLAKETMIQLISNGVSIVDIIDIYSEEELQSAAV